MIWKKRGNMHLQNGNTFFENLLKQYLPPEVDDENEDNDKDDED